MGVRWPTRHFLPRYEVHCWEDGRVDDIARAVEGPIKLTSDQAICYRMLGCLTELPAPVWGRDELHTGRCGTLTGDIV